MIGAGKHRARQAELTRTRIIEAARNLFLAEGYALTTIAAIARRAEVGASTVYAVFGNKRAILEAISGSGGGGSDWREILREASDEDDPPTRLEMTAHAARRRWENEAGTRAIRQNAAAADRDAGSALAREDAEFRRMAVATVDAIGSRLRSGLDAGMAIAVVLALARVEVYRELVEAHGWTPELYEAWLGATLCQQLLA